MTYQEFVERAENKGWTKLQDYTDNFKQVDFATKFEVWATPESEEMYFIEVLANSIIVIYKYVEDFNF